MSHSANYPDNTYNENRALSHLSTQIEEPEAVDNSLPKLFIVLSVITLAAFIAYCFSIDPPYISAFSSSILIVSGVLMARKQKRVKEAPKVVHHCGCCKSPLAEETHDSKEYLVCHWCREYGSH